MRWYWRMPWAATGDILPRLLLERVVAANRRIKERGRGSAATCSRTLVWPAALTTDEIAYTPTRSCRRLPYSIQCDALRRGEASLEGNDRAVRASAARGHLRMTESRLAGPTTFLLFFPPRRFTPAIVSITAHTAAVSSIAWPELSSCA